MKKHHIPFSFYIFAFCAKFLIKEYCYVQVLFREALYIHTRGRIRGIKTSLEGEAVGEGDLENAESGKGSRFCRTRENKSA
jgi:hypothetical protein